MINHDNNININLIATFHLSSKYSNIFQLKRIVERIKTRPGYKFIAVLLLLILPFYLLHLVNQSEINKIKNSDVDIICSIKGEGYVTIDKSKIIGVTDNGFIFENGYAENCYIEKGR